MRLRQNKLKTLKVLRPVAEESGYVGTEIKYLPDRTVRANVQPAESKRTVELYGERVKRMYTLLLNPPDKVQPEERVVISGRVYEVISAPEYSSHSVITVEEVQDGRN